MMAIFTNVVSALNDLREDMGVPRNLKIRVNDMIVELSNGGSDNSMLVNKLLSELEELSNDINLQPFVRTQIFNISSMLEALD